MPIPNTRYHRYSGFLEKYRYLQEISVISIPFDTVHVTAHLNLFECPTTRGRGEGRGGEGRGGEGYRGETQGPVGVT